jgi:3-dehydroquinate synthase
MNEIKTVKVKLKSNPHQYKIKIGHQLLEKSGEWASDSLSERIGKIVIVSNRKIFRLYGEVVRQSLKKRGFTVAIWLMKDGERYKNLRSLENLLKFLSTQKLTRSDAIVALGGGVIGDLAGFASAVYLRGIAFLQIPTTLLAMIDSSVGGKTGINSDFGKNLIGAFHQPAGVLIDVSTLKTLNQRELTAGFCEAVKHGAISGHELFDETAGFLRNYPVSKNLRKHFADNAFLEKLAGLLTLQVAFKAEVVMNDERESIGRNDSKSRKILNFGHTFAHALEKVTRYRYFKHGEAVGYGILFAAQLSKTLDFLDKNSLKLLNNVLVYVGNLPSLQNIEAEEIYQAFSFDKKNLGERLQWVLLQGIGQPIIVSSDKIPTRIIRQTIEQTLKSAS